MKFAVLALVSMLFSTSIAFAQQSCGDLPNQTEMNTCAAEAHKKSDAELNSLYKQIEGRLSDDLERKKRLISSQRAWVAFRDAECSFASVGVSGGSVYPFILSTCLDDLTNKRIEDFKGYLSCEEGDLSCPVPAN